MEAARRGGSMPEASEESGEGEGGKGTNSGATDVWQELEGTGRISLRVADARLDGGYASGASDARLDEK